MLGWLFTEDQWDELEPYAGPAFSSAFFGGGLIGWNISDFLTSHEYYVFVPSLAILFLTIIWWYFYHKIIKLAKLQQEQINESLRYQESGDLFPTVEGKKNPFE